MTSSQAQDATGTGVTSTGATPPFFPMSREASCPFDPPRHLREAAASHPVSRVRIWNDSTPWIITGHAEQRALLSDPRVSVNDRLPGFPHWHAGMEQVSTRRAPSVMCLLSRRLGQTKASAAPMNSAKARVSVPS